MYMFPTRPKWIAGLSGSVSGRISAKKRQEGLIESLDSKPQVLVEEKCTWEKRAELHDYFSYLGLDIITRRYMELETVVPPEEGRAKEKAGMGKYPNILNFIANGKMIFPHLRKPNRRPQYQTAGFRAADSLLGYLLGKIFDCPINAVFGILYMKWLKRLTVIVGTFTAIGWQVCALR